MNQRGLTLLELMLVLLILSSLALASANFLGSADGQARFEDTQRKLNSLRAAIIGSPFDARVDNLSGFVVDVGLLPKSVDQLINGHNHFADISSGFPPPIFDPKPDPVTGFNDGGTPSEVELKKPNERLVKGYRGGYLLTGPGFTGADAEFRDGFGNRSAVPNDGNFGWLFAPSPAVNPNSVNPNSLTIGSFGDLEGDYSPDVSLEIASHHWSLDPGTIDVDVVNRGGKAISWPGERLFLVLIVYKGGSVHRWLQIRSKDLGVAEIDSGATVRFQIQTEKGALVPMGQHLLVLVHAKTEDDPASEDFGTQLPKTYRRYTQRVTFRPGPHPTTTIQFLVE